VKKIYEEKTGRKMKKMDFKNCFWKKKKLKKITVSNREMNYSFKSVLTVTHVCMSSKGFGQIKQKNKRGFQVPNYLFRVI